MEAQRQRCRPSSTGSTTGKNDGPSSHEGTNAAAERISRELGEDQPSVCLNIRRLVAVIGVERADELVHQSKAVEAAGGMLIPDGSRRRTLGGVFFQLVRDTVPEDERHAAWPWQRPMTRDERRERNRLQRKAQRARQRRGTAQGKSTAQQGTGKEQGQSRAMSWQACRGLVDAALKKGSGVASTMKMTVIGRPGPVMEQGEAVLIVLQGAKVPTLPRGLPTPEKMPSCAVFISAKQWRRVADAIKNEQDALVIQGVPTLEPGFNGITVLATSVTTKLLDKAKREDSLKAQG